MHGESYEATKTKEVMAALKKKKLKDKVKKKIAADIVKRKGDTSKSDDRYAYESYGGEPIQGEGSKGKNKKELIALKKAAQTGKGKYVKKADEVDTRTEGYQRNPERDTRSARQRRMDDPDTGINSQAFRDFMAAQQKPSKPKKKKEVK